MGIDFSGMLEGTSQEELAAEAGGDFTLLPPGWYVGNIINVELKENKKKTGSYLEIELETKSGEKVIDRLNVINKSEQAQRIGRAQLAKLATILDIDLSKESSDSLLGREIGFKVTVQEFKSNRTGETLKSNDVKAYREAEKGAAVDAPDPENTKGDVPW